MIRSGAAPGGGSGSGCGSGSGASAGGSHDDPARPSGTCRAVACGGRGRDGLDQIGGGREIDGDSSGGGSDGPYSSYGGGGDGDGGGTQPLFDSQELGPASSSGDAESRDSGGDVAAAGCSAGVAATAAGGGCSADSLAAVAAALADLDGNSRQGTSTSANSSRTGQNQQCGIVGGGSGGSQLRLEGLLGSGSYGTVYRGTWQGLPVAVKTLVFSAAAEDEGRRRALREATLSASVSCHPNIVAIYAAEVEPLPGGQWGYGGGEGAAATAGTVLVTGGMRPLDPTSMSPGSTGASTSSADVAVADPAAAEATAAVVSPSVSARRRASGVADGGVSAGGAAIMDWRLYIIQEYADVGPLSQLYGDQDLWPSPGAPNLPAVVGLALGIARALSHLHAKRIIHGDLNPNNVLLKKDPHEPAGLKVKVGDFGLRSI